MEGRRDALQRDREHEVILAYRIMEIDRDNQKGMMKPLSKYLEPIKEAFDLARKGIGSVADKAAGVFVALKGKGKSVKIRERPKKEK